MTMAVFGLSVTATLSALVLRQIVAQLSYLRWERRLREFRTGGMPYRESHSTMIATLKASAHDGSTLA